MKTIKQEVFIDAKPEERRQYYWEPMERYFKKGEMR